MKKHLSQKGITLVALIITIVVLMILAAVTISTVMDTDILGLAQDAVDIYNNLKDESNKELDDTKNHLISEVECNHIWIEQSTIAATCTTAGEKASVCSKCGEKKLTETIAPLGHKYIQNTDSKYLVSTTVVCMQQPTYVKSCERCGAKSSETFKYGETLKHNFTKKVTSENYKKSDATCTMPATYYYSCINGSCTMSSKGWDDSTFGVGNPLGHNTKNGDILIQPTCTEEGKQQLVCTRCKAVVGNTYLDALGHNWEDKININKLVDGSSPVCTEDREFYKTCSRCSVKDENETFIVTGNSKHNILYSIPENEGNSAPNNGSYVINGKISHIIYGKCKNSACEVAEIEEYWHEENIYLYEPDLSTDIWRNYCGDCNHDFKIVEYDADENYWLNDESNINIDKNDNDWEYVYERIFETNISLVSIPASYNFTKKELAEYLSDLRKNADEIDHWESDVFNAIWGDLYWNIRE